MLPGKTGYIQLVRLSLVSHIKRTVDFKLVWGEPLHCHLILRAGQECVKTGVQCLNKIFTIFVALFELPQHCLRIIFNDICKEHPVSREQTAVWWNKHCLDAEILCHKCGMQTTSTAEGDEREIARIEPALHRGNFNGALHRCVSNLKNSVCRLQRWNAKTLRKFLNVCAGLIDIKGHRTP